MTFIEFFDKTATENICGCLVNVPDRVILVGDQRRQMDAHARRYEAFFADRGHKVEFIPKSITKNDMTKTVKALTEIVETYDDCVFDLTGGDEAYLVAIGIVSERCKDKNIQMHRFNLKNGKILDCDADGNTIAENILPQLTVEENIRVWGGDIVGCDEKPTGTYLWDLTDEFRADILALWSICARDVRLWNAQCTVLAAADALDGSDSLTVSVPLSRLRYHLSESGTKYVLDAEIMGSLSKYGFLRGYTCADDHLHFTYKNSQIKRCLTKAGNALELYIYLAALETAEKDGTPVYNDVMTGVAIDWDGEIHTEEGVPDTENEVDVLLMHGTVPVFVSCKNGFVEMDELYKLHTVAQRFGGRYAKKVLIATALDEDDGFAGYLRKRADDMDIRVELGIQNLSREELQDKVRTFWNWTR